MQPVFPVMKLKPLFAGINPLKNVLQINSKAHLDGLAGKAGVGASKIYNVLVGKFSKVKTGDDIISVANTVKVKEKIGNGGTAIMIKGGKEVGDSIKDKLIKDGWIIEKNTIDLVTLSKGKEKINFRNFDTSSTNGSYPGYTHQKTVEVLQYNGPKGVYGDSTKTEIKFILPQ